MYVHTFTIYIHSYDNFTQNLPDFCSWFKTNLLRCCQDQRLVQLMDFHLLLFLASSANFQVVTSHSHKETNVQRCMKHFALSLQRTISNTSTERSNKR